MPSPSQRGLRHDDDIYQGPATQSASAAPGYSTGGLDVGQVAALVALVALGALTLFRGTLRDVLPD